MNFMIIFGLFALAAYAVQIILGLKQIKHFNIDKAFVGAGGVKASRTCSYWTSVW